MPLIVGAYFLLKDSSSNVGFEKYRQGGGYKNAGEINATETFKQITPTKIEKIKSPSQYISSLQKEIITDERATKSCNLILKSKLSAFKRFDAFLSSPCREVAGQEISLNVKQQKSSLNWLLFYQNINLELEKLTYAQKEKLKEKLISQLSSPGNLTQASILGDVLINIMNKHEAVKAQEIEKLNNAMATEVEYLTNASFGLKKNDPLYISLLTQEIQAVRRYQREFRNIMDIK
jgi:hypothetical protein